MAPLPPGLDLSGPTLVVGLGKTGLSILYTLAALGAEASVVDSRAEPPGLAKLCCDLPTIPYHLGGFAPAAFARAQRLIVSPGVPLATPAIAAARARGVPVWGDIELFARLNHSVPVAAITGSNGKSTVTTLLGQMAARAGLAVAVGGNLGTPALTLLREHPKAELVVLELSSFQLEATDSLAPQAAAVLNISPDHLDRYANVADYAAAKQRIFRASRWCIVNADDARVRAMAAPGVAAPGSRVRCFTLAEPAADEFGLRDYGGEIWLAYGPERWLAARELHIAGRHNLANVLAALALGHALGLARAPMLAAVRMFCGLPHRSEVIAEYNGVCWINDSKGTNVGATVATAQGLPGQLVLIAGGEGKGQDFTPLSDLLAHKARALVTLGRDGPAIAAVAPPGVPVESARDMAHAVALAMRWAQPGDSVVLSPACASFDMFANYEARGAAFIAAVRAHLP